MFHLSFSFKRVVNAVKQRYNVIRYNDMIPCSSGLLDFNTNILEILSQACIKIVQMS